MWESESLGVMYHAASGDTHVVDALTLELASVLNQQSVSTDALVAYVQNAVGSSDKNTLTRLVVNALSTLAELDIIYAHD